jgi:hypothetical protein
MPRLSLPSLLHQAAALLSASAALSGLCSLLSPRGAFPADILAELEQISFGRFNTAGGAAGSLVPRVVHILHTGRGGLGFLEAAQTRAAIRWGGVDLVYIHSVHGAEGRYLAALLADPLLAGEEQMMVLRLPRDPPDPLAAGLGFLSVTGGVFLPAGILLMADLEPLLNYEAAAVFRGEVPVVVMAHPRARVLARPLAHLADPGLVKRLPPSLLGSGEEDDLPALLGRTFVRVAGNLTEAETEREEGPGPALLRRAWWDTPALRDL